MATIPSSRAAAPISAPPIKALIDRVNGDVQKTQTENPGAAIPVDLVTTSGSGLDPDISPAAAEFQIPRVARERAHERDRLRALVAKHTEARQFGFLGEPRVNVLELNLDLDASHPQAIALSRDSLSREADFRAGASPAAAQTGSLPTAPSEYISDAPDRFRFFSATD